MSDPIELRPLSTQTLARPAASCGLTAALGNRIVAALSLLALALVGPAAAWDAENTWLPPYVAAEPTSAPSLTANEALDLFDPAISPDQVLEELGDLLLDDDGVAEDRGGPSATGYSAHRKWGVGGANGYGLDQFGGASSGVYRARAAARLANGDVVVVGEVQGNSVSAVRNLGMVKFNRRGQRVAWTAVPSQFAHFSSYILFPGTDAWGGTRTVLDVVDVKVRGSDIYVLITLGEGGRFFPGIIRWGDNGSSRGWWSSAPDGGTVRSAIAMDIEGSNMIVLGRRSNETTTLDGGFWTSRWTINADGGLSLGATTTFLAGDRRVPSAVAFSRYGLATIALSPAYYVAYTYNNGSTSTSQHRPCVTRIRSNNTLDPDFGAAGISCFPFAEGGNSVDLAAGLHTRGFLSLPGPTATEHLYLTADVDRNLARGIGVIKLRNGVADTSFGSGGRRLYGGCASLNPSVGEGCGFTVGPIQNPHSAHLPFRGALFADSSGVYVAGRTFRPSIAVGEPPSRRPVFMHVDDGNGALRSLQTFGTYPNSQFTALVPRPGTSEFTVVGHASDADTTDLNAGPKRFLSAHLIRNNDLIFYDGLQP